MIARLRKLLGHRPDATPNPVAITPEQAARVLSRHAHLTQREKVKAVARDMREHLGLPHAPELNPRT